MRPSRSRRRTRSRSSTSRTVPWAARSSRRRRAEPQFEARLARLRGRLPGQTLTSEIETLLKACDRLTAAEEAWGRELAFAGDMTGHRHASENARSSYAQRPSLVNRLQQDIAEENLRQAERERAGLENERLGLWEAATRALAGDAPRP